MNFDPKKLITALKSAVYNEIQRGGPGQEVLVKLNDTITALEKGTTGGGFDPSALMGIMNIVTQIQAAQADPQFGQRFKNILQDFQQNSGFDPGNIFSMFGGMFGGPGGFNLKDIFDMFGGAGGGFPFPGGDNNRNDIPPPPKKKDDDIPPPPKKDNKPKGGDSFDLD